MLIDWYERRDELEPDQVFQAVDGIVKLDHRVPGDGTKWCVQDWWNGSWAAMESTVEPGDLIERLPDDFGEQTVQANQAPSDWEVHRGDDYTRVLRKDAHTDDFIADVADPEVAPLIAAAPNLLAVAREAQAEIDQEIKQRKHGGNDEAWAELQGISDRIATAIAKATVQ